MLETYWSFQIIMWPVMLAMARNYAPYLVLPIAAGVGFIGIKEYLGNALLVKLGLFFVLNQRYIL